MKDVAKRVLLHVIVGLVLFVAALAFFNFHISREKDQDFSEMANSTYPVMEVRSENGEYNIMSAYLDEVDLSLVRNQITVVDRDGVIDLTLHNYDYDITAIQYELFTKSGEKSLEEGTLNKLELVEEENVRHGSIVLETNLEKDKNYYLKMSVRLDKNRKVNFYTKVINGEGYHLKECMTYANEFHKNLFDKSKFEKNITFLEPSGKTTTNLEKVDIHSSVDAVSFGNMSVKQETDPVITVKEINDVYAVLEMQCILSAEIREGVIQYYDVNENYKIRYTSDRMYLLDYERTMDAYYNKALNDPSKNYVTLGIQNAANIDYRSSDSGYKVAFVQQGQLWYYNYQASDIAKVFSFSSENIGDLRNIQKNHGIKILQMDDDGNIVYIVYGYMNRGHYEGRNGIQLLRYNAKNNCNEEMAFLSTSLPYNSMKADVEKLVYLSGSNVFYCLLDGDLHSINLKDKKDTIVESGMINENITASKDNSIIAVEAEKNLSKNRSIRMIDLESGKDQEFTCEKNQRIGAVGFLSNDFIYGIASAFDVRVAESGALTFPMESLVIVNIDGKKVKSYKKTNRYILETDIVGSVLEMKFGKKVNSKIVTTSDKDYIRYKEAQAEIDLSLVYDYSTTYYEQLFMRFPNYVYIQIEPDLILTKILSGKDVVSINLERSRQGKVQYYVYSEGKEQDIYDNLAQAIQTADELKGNVISSEEETMWQRGFVSYAMVAGMDQVTKVSSNKKSLAGCLQMIAKVNGKQVALNDIKTDGKNVVDLVEKYSGHPAYNLSGCSIDQLLYYVSKGSPILAKYNSKRYVIVMSYNSSKLRYLDPVTGKSEAVSREALTNTFMKAGNRFYTYLNE